MPIIKCKICGGDMNISEDKTYGICEYCGCTMTLPKVNDEQKLAAFNRGNHFRMSGEFDKALQVYEHIISEDDTDAEAHWCAALCRFGIEWVEDPATLEYLPTCHRLSFDLFTDDVDYLAALEHSDGITKRQYQKDAAKIVEVQRGVLATSQNEKPFDVFICYKESDENGQRTIDSTLAQEIYYQLTDQGLRVFFSRITLEDKAGSEYEPYIFAALNSAKAMVVVGTKPEYFNAVWVKNEWSRYLALVKRDRHKVLLPCYRDMDPYDLPEQLSVLQSYDMSKIGFIQDLIRGIKKITTADEPKAVVKETIVTGGSTNVAPLLKRAFLFLEDGNWKEADEYCERVLDQDPENAEAYLGKMMAELRVKQKDSLSDCAKPFSDSVNYQKILRFGNDKLVESLKKYIDQINERNELARLEEIYAHATNELRRADSEESYKAIGKTFKSIAGFKDADTLAEQCIQKAEESRQKAEEKRKNDIYASGKKQMGNTIPECEAAIRAFRSIPGWRDADKLIIECRQRIEKIQADYEAEQLQKAKEEEERQIKSQEMAKKRKKALLIGVFVALFVAVGIIIIVVTVLPHIRYESAMKLYNAKDYKEAHRVFSTLDWNDSKDKANECLLLMQKNSFLNVNVGSVIKYGVYEQDCNESNGKEEIEWLVLEIKDNKALLLSKYSLDTQPYNQTSTSTTWEKCTLRKWLNETFLIEAFGSQQPRRIVDTIVVADRNPSYSSLQGNDTVDKVFLFSRSEVTSYYGSEASRECQGTAFCYAQGANKSVNGNCWWWLRSSGSTNDGRAAYIGDDGSLNEYGMNVDNLSRAVRPALWISLEDNN